MRKATVSAWIKEVEKHRDRVAKTRDALDAAIDEMLMMKDSCERAYDDLQAARDALSELA